MEQLKFDFFSEENKKINKEKKYNLNTGEIIQVTAVEVLEKKLVIKFNITKPNGVIVEKIFDFNFDEPKQNPKIQSRVLQGPEGVRVFENETFQREAEEISYPAFKKIKNIAFGIFKDRKDKYNKYYNKKP